MDELRTRSNERTSIRYTQAEYLLQRTGQPFEGIVSGLTSRGVYVEMRANKCEGMITLRDIPGDHFKSDQALYTVIGQRTGRRIRLGDEVLVTVLGVDMDKRTVDLALAGTTPPRPSPVGREAKWDETSPRAERQADGRNFGNNGKRGAANARERNRRAGE